MKRSVQRKADVINFILAFIVVTFVILGFSSIEPLVSALVDLFI